MALFTGVFVGMVILITEYFIAEGSIVLKALIAGISTLIGGSIGNKLFPHKESEK